MRSDNVIKFSPPFQPVRGIFFFVPPSRHCLCRARSLQFNSFRILTRLSNNHRAFTVAPVRRGSNGTVRQRSDRSSVPSNWLITLPSVSLYFLLQIGVQPRYGRVHCKAESLYVTDAYPTLLAVFNVESRRPRYRPGVAFKTETKPAKFIK